MAGLRDGLVSAGGDTIKQKSESLGGPRLRGLSFAVFPQHADRKMPSKIGQTVAGQIFMPENTSAFFDLAGGRNASFGCRRGWTTFDCWICRRGVGR
jgi:hypothetical protein